jgi:hypothetical protein
VEKRAWRWHRYITMYAVGVAWRIMFWLVLEGIRNCATPSIPDYRAITHFETNFDL